MVLVDTDIDGDNGYVRATTGICGSSKTIAYEVQDVPKGTYYIYAVVRIVSAIDSPPEYGDYIGFYGTGSMPPAAPNASITGKEAESFEITLTVFSEEIDGDLAYMIEDFDGEFIGTTDYGNIPLGWSVSGPQVVNFMQGMDSHHGQFCLHANASTNQTEYTYLKAELEGQPGTLTDLQIQAKADTSGKAEARFLIEDAVIPMSTTLFWYDYSSTDWRTVTFEDVEISASGKLSFYIDIAHTDDNGSSNFYIDCFTSDTPLTLLLPDASDDDNVKDDNGGNGNTSCYIYTVKY